MTEESKNEKALRKYVEAEAESHVILSAAERLLSLQPQHTYALQCKSMALLHMGRFSAALAVLQRLGKEKKHRTVTLAFQQAYCHYRLAQYVEAKAALAEMGSTSLTVPCRHLLAQIHYNLEEFAEAAAMFDALLRDHAYRDETEKTELLINYSAALSACDAAKAVTVVRDEAEEKTEDLLFNVAAAQIELQEYDAAKKSLTQAEQRCATAHPHSRLRSLEDALACKPQELEERLVLPLVLTAEIAGKMGSATAAAATAERRFFNSVASYWVQLAYIAYASHDEERAKRIVDIILTFKPTSVVTTAVAAILSSAMQRDSDFFASHRKLKAAQHTRIVARLTSRQLLAIRYNTALLHLSAGSLDRCRRGLEQMEAQAPNNELTHSLRLALAVREQRKRKGSGTASGIGGEAASVMDTIHQYEGQLPVMETGAGRQLRGGDEERHQRRFAKLVAAQLFLEHGDIPQAITALRDMDDATFTAQPATLVTTVALMVQIGQADKAVAMMTDRLVSKSSSGFSTKTKKELLAWAVHYLAISRGCFALVEQLILAIKKSDGALAKDKEVLALFVLCLAHTNLTAARDAAREVNLVSVSAPSTSGATPSEEGVQSLLRHHPGRAVLDELGYRRTTAVDGETDKVPGRRRHRPLRRPAAVTDGRADPERWVPMNARSYIKDLPERRKKELRRLRALEQEHLRRAAIERAKRSHVGDNDVHDESVAAV